MSYRFTIRHSKDRSNGFFDEANTWFQSEAWFKGALRRHRSVTALPDVCHSGIRPRAHYANRLSATRQRPTARRTCATCRSGRSGTPRNAPGCVSTNLPTSSWSSCRLVCNGLHGARRRLRDMIVYTEPGIRLYVAGIGVVHVRRAAVLHDEPLPPAPHSPVR